MDIRFVISHEQENPASDRLIRPGISSLLIPLGIWNKLKFRMVASSIHLLGKVGKERIFVWCSPSASGFQIHAYRFHTMRWVSEPGLGEYASQRGGGKTPTVVVSGKGFRLHFSGLSCYAGCLKWMFVPDAPSLQKLSVVWGQRCCCGKHISFMVAVWKKKGGAKSND